MQEFIISSSKVHVHVSPNTNNDLLFVVVTNNSDAKRECYELSTEHYSKLASYKSASALVKYAQANERPCPPETSLTSNCKEVDGDSFINRLDVVYREVESLIEHPSVTTVAEHDDLTNVLRILSHIKNYDYQSIKNLCTDCFNLAVSKGYCADCYHDVIGDPLVELSILDDKPTDDDIPPCFRHMQPVNGMALPNNFE